jgi:glycosyltransferase involved in cell wall biosynthesis
MRIAVLGIKHLPAFAGADRVVEQLLDHSSEGNEYTVYLLRDGLPRLSSTRNRHYVYIPGLKGKHLRPFSYFLFCCFYYLVKGRYDIAHVHNSDFGLFCPLLKLKRRVHVIGTFHGDPYEREKWSALAKSFLRLSEWFFTHSCDVLTSVASSKQVQGRTVQYIPNGVELWTPPQVESDFPYRELGLEEGRYVMFACGRLDRTKGLHHLLRGYRDLPGTERLLAVGDFSHDRGYSKAVREMADDDSRVVLYDGLLDRTTLFDVIHHSSVFVFPSEVEAMAMMLLETIACRKIVVCSDIPENVAVVGSDYPFLFKSKDASSLGSVLQEALRSLGEAEIATTYKRVMESFRWDAIATNYERLYDAAS